MIIPRSIIIIIIIIVIIIIIAIVTVCISKTQHDFFLHPYIVVMVVVVVVVLMVVVVVVVVVLMVVVVVIVLTKITLISPWLVTHTLHILAAHTHTPPSYTLIQLFAFNNQVTPALKQYRSAINNTVFVPCD